MHLQINKKITALRLQEFLQKNLSAISYLLLFAGMALRLFFAFKRQGYDHPNEIFRVMEPVNFILNGYYVPAFEYDLKMLSWFPSLLHALVLKLLILVSSPSPLQTLTFFRVLYAGLSLIPLVLIFQYLKNKTSAIPALLGLTFLCLFPPLIYWQVHLFDTNLEIVLAALCIYLFQKPTPKHSRDFLIGTLLGLCFFIRYQSILYALTLLGIALYRRQWSRVLPTFLGAVLIALIAGLVDQHFGIPFLQAPWNYFSYNILQGNAASQFGRAPFYRYFFDLAKFYYYLPFLWVIFYYQKGLKNSEAWGLTSFIYFLVHSLIAHKEFRFIFSILPIIPAVVIVGHYNFQKQLPWKSNFLPPFFFKKSMPVLLLAFLLTASTLRFFLKNNLISNQENCDRLEKLGDYLRLKEIHASQLAIDNDFTFSCGSFPLGKIAFKQITYLSNPSASTDYFFTRKKINENYLLQLEDWYLFHLK
jgi:hypothetical protein